MKIAPEHQKDFEAMPAVLRKLLEAELASGNEIVEVAHCFPAPPAGAYFKLTKPVSTRNRASGDGIVFYDRNSSIYSGEFTDVKRFYFILEPPNPPPPEPDMDAIRAAREAKQRAADAELYQALRPVKPNRRKKSVEVEPPTVPPRPAPASGPQPPPHSVLQSSTPTGAKWLLYFHDKRPPQEIQFQLERDLMTLMPPAMEFGKLVCCAKSKVTGALYAFRFTYEAALPQANCYSLRVEASWADMPATHHDYFRKTSGSWFELWTHHFMRSSPPPAGAGDAGRYQRGCDDALKAETGLNSAEAIQQAIVTAMKRGASFSTSHKEGGTSIGWLNGKFVRADYGESEDRKEFATEVEFLKFLRQFYDWETSKNIYPDKVSDFEAWKLILRLLRR